MSAFNQIKLPDNTTLDVNDARIRASSPSNGQVLGYNATSGKFENINLPNGIMIVHIDITNDDVYACDTTISAIIQAITNGTMVYAISPIFGEVIFSLATYSLNGDSFNVVFSFIYGIYNIQFEGISQNVNGNFVDTWEYIDDSITLNEFLDISTLQDGDIIVYDASSGNWINGTIPRGNLPSVTGNSGKALFVNSSETGTIWSNIDYSFTPLTSINHSNSNTVELIQFAPYERNTQWIDASVDIHIAITESNRADNYILINNTSNSDIDVIIDSINSTELFNVVGGEIVVSAGKMCEIGVLRYIRTINGVFKPHYIITHVEI